MDEKLKRIVDAALSPIPAAKVERAPRLSASAQEAQERQNELDVTFLMREHYCALHGVAFALGKSGAVDAQRFADDLLAGARAFSIGCGGVNVIPPLASSLALYFKAGAASRRP